MTEQVQDRQILFPLSPSVNKMLEDAARLYGLSASAILSEIVAENLPKWVQKYHVRHSFSKAAEKIKNSASPESVLLSQEELDKVFSLMSAAAVHAVEYDR
ncbi:MAG: hypothetical protein LBT33_05210 [Spirochaetia bacterium]|nr:hypothetical protein [Spirochaetia bacterium]